MRVGTRYVRYTCKVLLPLLFSFFFYYYSFPLRSDGLHSFIYWYGSLTTPLPAFLSSPLFTCPTYPAGRSFESSYSSQSATTKASASCSLHPPRHAHRHLHPLLPSPNSLPSSFSLFLSLYHSSVVLRPGDTTLHDRHKHTRHTLTHPNSTHTSQFPLTFQSSRPTSAP